MVAKKRAASAPCTTRWSEDSAKKTNDRHATDPHPHPEVPTPGPFPTAPWPPVGGAPAPRGQPGAGHGVAGCLEAGAFRLEARHARRARTIEEQGEDSTNV